MTALKISGMRALGKSACTVCLAVFLLNANAEEALDDKTVTSRLVGYWFNISGARSEDAGIHIEVHTLTYRKADGSFTRIDRPYSHGIMQPDRRTTGKWRVVDHAYIETRDLPAECRNRSAKASKQGPRPEMACPPESVRLEILELSATKAYFKDYILSGQRVDPFFVLPTQPILYSTGKSGK